MDTGIAAIFAGENCPGKQRIKPPLSEVTRPGTFPTSYQAAHFWTNMQALEFNYWVILAKDLNCK